MTQEILTTAEQKMKKTIDSFVNDLKTVRTGRPNPEIFKSVQAECYGTYMPISDLASITVPSGQLFLITPFDKSNLKALEAAIAHSDLNLNPSNDGDVIRINVPPLSQERRLEMVKKVGKLGEEKGKIPIRSIRQSAKDEIKALEKQGISKDDVKRGQDELEKLTKSYISKIDTEIKNKEEELMKV